MAERLIDYRADVTALGGLVARLRDGMELTQRELARRAGVSHGDIAFIEQGRIRRPSLKKLGALERVLGCQEVTIRPGRTYTGERTYTKAERKTLGHVLRNVALDAADASEAGGDYGRIVERFSVDFAMRPDGRYTVYWSATMEGKALHAA